MRQVPDKTVPGFYVQDALAHGYHLGFVGSSDGHNVMPGQSCIACLRSEADAWRDIRCPQGAADVCDQPHKD